jgi:hypothetical protein
VQLIFPKHRALLPRMLEIRGGARARPRRGQLS